MTRAVYVFSIGKQVHPAVTCLCSYFPRESDQARASGTLSIYLMHNILWLSLTLAFQPSGSHKITFHPLYG